MIVRLLNITTVLLISVLGIACSGSSPGSNEETGNDTTVTAVTKPSSRIAELTAIIEEDPANADAYNERAMLYLGKQKVNKALRDISRALELKPDHPAYLISLSDVYFGLNQPDKTRQTLLHVLEVEPANTNACLKLAELSLYFRDYEGVQSYAQRALKVDPNLAQAYFIMGFASKEQGDTAAAIRDFQLTTTKDPDHFQAYMQLGVLMSAASDPLAEEYFKKALALDGSSLEALYNLGMYYQENEMYNEAMAAYNDIIRIEPSFRMAYYNLGYIHLAYLGVYAESVKYFNQAIQADPGYYEAYYNRGYAQELMGDPINARESYQQALKIKPDYVLAIEGLNRLDQGDERLEEVLEQQ